MRNALIILNYNDAENTLKLAAAVHDYASIDKIILVDNLSPNGSFALLKEHEDEKIEAIQAPKNGGYAAGNNYGAFYALEKYSPDFITIANPDVAFDDETLADMLSALETDESYGLCGVMVNQRYNAWNLLRYGGMIESLFLGWFNLHRRIIRRRLERGEHIEQVGVISGSFYSVKAEAYKKAEGLDEGTFLFEEENIFAYRLRDKGYKEIILTDRFYDHFHSQSIKKSYPSKAKAFKLYLPSLKYFNKNYLHTCFLGDALFYVCYWLGYVERVLFDIPGRLKHNKKNK